MSIMSWELPGISYTIVKSLDFRKAMTLVELCIEEFPVETESFLHVVLDAIKDNASQKELILIQAMLNYYGYLKENLS